MARRRTNTLSDALLADFKEATTRVLTTGTPTGTSRPFGDTDSPTLWFVADSQVDDGTNVGRMNYSGKLYTSITATTAVSSTAVKARNTYEAKNTSSVRAGYTVSPSSTTCVDITGIEPAPKLIPYIVLGRVKVGSDWFYIFAHRNDPTVYLNASGTGSGDGSYTA